MKRIMARYTSYSQRILAYLILAAMCFALARASPSGTKRQDGEIAGESSQRTQERTRRSQSFKLSTSKSNEIIGETGRKVSHRLIGGHLRTNRPSPGDEVGATGGLWDDGFLISSAGNGKERKNVRNDDDDDKKTLSQQVKEGKYGLIQNEIYGERPKRPGIISYHGNPEVPRDTITNLGGLDEEEIWLAENHMLVIRGGKFPEHDAEGENDAGRRPWPPIDDYQAPKRQVKIPSRPKVPPPFPVQLAEDGPVQIIGPNGTTEIDKGSLDYENNPFYRKGSLPGEGPFFAITANGTLLPTDLPLTGNSTKSSAEERSKFAQPPDGIPGSIFHSLPPGAVFVPPPSNQTDYDDEDQSIYYPPPYSFQYPQDNSTAVPPGPLVPGIILPPPPDFFSSLDEKKTTTKKYARRPAETTAPLPRARPTYLPPRKLTTKYQKSSTPAPTTAQKNTIVSPVSAKATDRGNCRNGTCSSRLSTRNYQKSMSYPKLTTPQPPQKSTTDKEFYSIRPVIGNQVSESNTEAKSQWSEVDDSKVPVISYYPSTTSSTVERPLEVTPASIKNILRTNEDGRVPNQASYYFYEESNENTAGTTVNQPALFYRTTTESPYFRVELQNPQEEKKSEYYRVEGLPEESSKGFSLINSLVKDPQVYYTDSVVTSKPLKYKVSSARAQSHRVLADPPIYYQTITDRPSVEIETFHTTVKPENYYEGPKQVSQFDYREGTKPKPIYQYSFETADYTGAGNSRPYRYQSSQDHRQQVLYNDYADTQSENIRYNQNSQHLRAKVPYKTQRPVGSVPTTTQSPIADTTENPQQTYFTQQEERLLDDVTKEYFTIFGKKLAGKGLPSTTPLYGKSSTERPGYEKNVRNYKPYVRNEYNSNYDGARSSGYQLPNVDVQYGDMPQHRPYSLKDDTLVNYKAPLPTINPDSEFISMDEPKGEEEPSAALRNYGTLQRVETIETRPNRERLTTIRGYGNHQHQRGQAERLSGFSPINGPQVESFPIRPPSLADDIAVNYNEPRPPINPDAEFIDTASLQGNNHRPEKASGYFAYRLPGDGGHFYFLTPQTVSQRQEQHGAYLYSKPRASRLLRRRRGPARV